MDNSTLIIILFGFLLTLILIVIYLIFFVIKNYKKTETNLLKRLEEINQYLFNSNKELQEKEISFGNRILLLQENINKKESTIEQKKSELAEQKKNLKEREEKIVEEESKFAANYNNFLEKKAKITIEQAKKEVNKIAEQETAQDFLDWQRKFLYNTKAKAEVKACEIIALAIQRCSSEVTNEQTITNIKLQNDNEKGKIIGKAGKNLQWLEKTLGVELVIDDNNEGVIAISGFSSIRRHLAKRTIEKLLEDGRIHPASIEDNYEKSKAELANDVAIAGEWACNELSIYDFSPKLIRLIGRLNFRSSYGQNMLKHSVEMAKLAKNIATEINSKFTNKRPIDIDICVKGALLHDIGKAIDEESQPKGNHIDIGEKICDMFELDWRIKKCVSSHHDESYYDNERGFCIEAAIVDACDNISGSRLGARKDSTEAYHGRLGELEDLANNIKGINKSWVMRGGKELWVFFDTKIVNPHQIKIMTKQIADSIEDNVKHTSEIKIVGLWEDKVIEYAR